jgi:hypothetical protein
MSVLDGADVPSSDQLHSNGCSPNKWKSCVSVCVRARGSLIEGTNPLT